MKTFSSLCAIMAVFILLTSCRSTGQKALQQGRYAEACQQATNKLRSSPNNKKAIEALRQAYPLATNYTEKEVERLSLTSLDDKDVRIYDLYNTMNKLASDISQCPAAMRTIPNVNYYNLELGKAREKAAEYFYRDAEALFKMNQKHYYREAYDMYLEADNISHNYKNALSKADEAKARGTLNVVVELAPIDKKYVVNADFFMNNLFKNFPPSLFFKMYSPEEAKNARLNPDYRIRLNFQDFAVGAGRQASSTKEVVRDSVIIGTYTDKRNRTYDVYGTVKAELTLVQVETVAQGALYVQTIDLATGRTIEQKSFPGSFTWSDYWGTYNGDDRALTEEEYATCQRKPLPLPPPQELFAQLAKPIYVNFSKYLDDFIKSH